MGIKPVSVSQLNNYIKRILAADPILMNISVCGEVSNLTRHSSGHWYFNLKDENAKINCFLPSSRVNSMRFVLNEGMQIIAHGNISVYDRGGYYSLNIRDIDADGEGALNIAYEKLKLKLSEEGLFDESHKKAIPQFPKTIGVVTSPTGAAIKDIITTLKLRNQLVNLILYPCQVQGSESAPSICRGIEYFNRKKNADVIIIGRGGGSIEDLWSFNEESVARAIYNSDVPIVSAVGHERDFVISDFAADLRAATPTAAAELSVPDLSMLKNELRRYSPVNMFSFIEDQIERTELQARRWKESVDNSVIGILNSDCHRLEMLMLDIDASNPLNVLNKGYAVVKQDDNWIISASQLIPKGVIKIIFKDGTVTADIKEVEIKDE